MRRPKARTLSAVCLFSCAMATVGQTTRADAITSEPTDQPSDVVSQAREAFVQATALARQMQWSEALAGFQQSMTARPHAVTAYNIGLCFRALGQYTHAHASFELALARIRDVDSELTTDLVQDATTYLAEMRRLLVRLDLQVLPAQAKVLVDGRPLEFGKLGEEPVWFMGTHTVDEPSGGPSGRFVLVLDPGTHLLLFSMPGFHDVLVRRNFAPGERVSMPLHLDTLPGELSITASVPGAVVRVDSLDEGVVPVRLSRTPGRHWIDIRHPDYLEYRTDVELRGGEETSLRATLQHRPDPITKKWWFWGTAAVIIGAVIVGTVVATRSEAQAPPVDRGNLGWAADVR